MNSSPSIDLSTRNLSLDVAVTADFAKPTGKKIMPLHGVNSGPRTKSFVYDARPLFVEAGLPSVRLHDVEYPFGSGEYVDIPCIFKNFDADENDPASYNFALTDEYIRACLSVGSRIFYRLGVSIEHSPVKRYTNPPKDYAKWARICEHIIRHYNEGWADGHRWNIEDWEIWNESDAESTKLWSGTQEEFIKFYTVASKHLKSCFPHLRIGGCGFTGGRPDNVEKFIRGVAETGAPLDFLSFHCYSDTPRRMLALWKRFRACLDENGFEKSETMLTEWNYMGSWESIIQPTFYPAMKDHRGAAFYASVLCALQKETDLTLAHYFEADVVKEFCGIFDVKEMRISIRRPATLKPTKGFYAFKAYNSLFRMGEAVEVTGTDSPEIYTLAANGACGNGVIIANNSSSSVILSLSLKNASGSLVLRLTDECRTYEIVKTATPEDAESLKQCLPPHSFLYVGTDLEDPVPTYEYDCYKGISTTPSSDSFF